jgi:hypothetical protein
VEESDSCGQGIRLGVVLEIGDRVEGEAGSAVASPLDGLSSAVVP